MNHGKNVGFDFSR